MCFNCQEEDLTSAPADPYVKISFHPNLPELSSHDALLTKPLTRLSCNCIFKRFQLHTQREGSCSTAVNEYGQTFMVSILKNHDKSNKVKFFSDICLHLSNQVNQLHPHQNAYMHLKECSVVLNTIYYPLSRTPGENQGAVGTKNEVHNFPLKLSITIKKKL